MSKYIQHITLGKVQVLIDFQDAKSLKSIALVESMCKHRYTTYRNGKVIPNDYYILYSNTNDLTICGFIKMTYDSGRRMSLSAMIKRFHTIKNSLEFVNFR